MTLTYMEMNALKNAIDDLQQSNFPLTVPQLDYFVTARQKLERVLESPKEQQEELKKKHAAKHTETPFGEIQVEEWGENGQLLFKADQMELMQTQKEVDIEPFPKEWIEQPEVPIGMNTYQALRILFESNSSES